MRSLLLTLVAITLATAAAATPVDRIRIHSLSRAPSVSLTQPSAPDERGDALASRVAEAVGHVRSAQLRRRMGLAGSAASDATGFVVTRRSRVGTPMQIRGGVLEAAGPDGAAASVDADTTTARRFLALRRKLLRLDNPDQELDVSRYSADELGRRHVRFAQRYRGLAVWPAEINVHLDANGNVDLVEGAYVATPRDVATQPAITAEQAVAAARAAVVGGDAAIASTPSLIVYAPMTRQPRLAWTFTLSVRLAARWRAVIDATNAQVLAAFNEVTSESVDGSGIDLLGQQQSLKVFRDTDGTFFMVDTSKPMFDPTSQPPDLNSTRGGITILDARNQPPTSNVETLPELFYVTSDSSAAWLPADAVSAAVGLAQTFDYYRTRHARNSIDGQGGSMIGVVRVGQNFFNAFWDGSEMVFGDADRFPASIDVVAHELTHGVTDYTANLIYQGQSGAMNESFSDIFGESAEAFVKGNNDWLIGSDLTAPIRSMEDPHMFGDPARMSEFVTTTDDNGGVHTNSGIFNHAYYLVTDGLNNAIGIRDAERIFYRALSVHLVANAQMIDGRLAAVASAEELFGAGSAQAQAVADAFDAVQIFDGNPTPDPTPFPPVGDADDSTLSLFFDDTFQTYRLDRRETALGDPNEGVQLVEGGLSGARPSVSGDGTLAVYVDENDDVCFVLTDGTPIDPETGTTETCLNVNAVNSVAMAPDGDHYGFVLLDDNGMPDNFIRVIDVSGPTPISRSYELQAPVEDGSVINTVKQADTMDLTADNRYLIYDALNHLRLNDGTEVDVWSIYKLDLLSERTFAIISPIAGVDVAYPALSQTSDSFMVFDAFDETTEQSTVMTANLSNGDRDEIATVDGYGVPGYTGDDSAIVYSQADDNAPTGFDLMRQPVSDRLTRIGNPTAWLDDADFGVIYRRGTFTGPVTPTPSGPTPTPTRTPTRGPTSTPGPCFGDCDNNGRVQVNELVLGVNIALNRESISACESLDSDGNNQVRVNELVAAVNAALHGCR